MPAISSSRIPDYLVEARLKLRKKPFSFDSVGLSLLVIVMVCWEVVLSKGQEWDWLGDPFWRVQTLLVLFGVGLVGLIYWELRHHNPVVNFHPLRERNFATCCVIIFFAFAVLYGASTSLPGLLQSLFGYDALSAGLVMSPAGLFAVLAMPAIGVLLGRGADARWLLATGLLVMAAGNYWMSQMTLDISPGEVVWPRVLLVLGLSMCFAPANMAAYLYTPLELRGAAVGLLSLLRNEGGSVGTSMAQTLQERRDQFHTLRLGEYLDPFNPAVSSFIGQVQTQFDADGLAPPEQLSWQAIENLRPAASVFAFLFRLLLDLLPGDACPRLRGAADEALRGRKGRSHRWGVSVAGSDARTKPAHCDARWDPENFIVSCAAMRPRWASQNLRGVPIATT